MSETKIKERPILFQGEMVRALLEGRKTQTRRIVKPQPSSEFHPENKGVAHWYAPTKVNKRTGEMYPGADVFGVADEDEDRISPYGKPGERLWVRETWQDVHPCQIFEDRFTTAGRAGIPGPPAINYEVIYRADGEYPKLHFSDKYPFRRPCIGATCKKSHVHPEENYNGWEPSIFMPRWASRISLEITEVRVERLQEISENDSEKEGVPHDNLVGYYCEEPTHNSDGVHRCNYRIGYKMLWERINGKQSWEQNPWVWVVTFRMVKER